MADAWSSPFESVVRKRFKDQMVGVPGVPGVIGPGAVIEERTVKFAYMLGIANSDDYGSGSSPLVVDVIGSAMTEARAAGPTDNSAAGTGKPSWPSSVTQEPKLATGGLVPVGTSILIGGIGVVVMLPLVVARASEASETAGVWSPAAAADDALNGVQAAFDCAMIAVSDARTQRTALSGHETTSYGTSRVAAYGPPTAGGGDPTTLLYSGQATAKDRGWAKIAPIYFDGGGNGGRSASQIQVAHIIPRSTAWPILAGTRIRVEVMLRCLIGYQGSAGAIVCDPATNMPVQVPPGYPPVNQRIQPPEMW